MIFLSLLYTCDHCGAEEMFDFISNNKVFNKYLSACEKTAYFIICLTLCSSISKNKVQTGQILDGKVW